MSASNQRYIYSISNCNVTGELPSCLVTKFKFISIETIHFSIVGSTKIIFRLRRKKRYREIITFLHKHVHKPNVMCVSKLAQAYIHCKVMVSFLCELNFIQNAVILLQSVCEIVWTDMISSIELDWPFSFSTWICIHIRWKYMAYDMFRMQIIWIMSSFFHFDQYHCESILEWNLEMDVCVEIASQGILVFAYRRFD